MKNDLFLAVSDDLALIAPAEQLSDLVKALRVEGWHFSVVSRNLSDPEPQSALEGLVTVLSLPSSTDEAVSWLEHFLSQRVARNLTSLPQSLLVICPACTLQRRRRLAALGVGDWLIAPYTDQELLFRIERLRKGLQPLLSPRVVAHPSAPYVIDSETGYLVVPENSRSVYLTAGERAVLISLFQAMGKVVPRDELARSMGCPGAEHSGSLNTIVLRLRHKLEHVGLNRMQLITVSKRGYRLSQ